MTTLVAIEAVPRLALKFFVDPKSCGRMHGGESGRVYKRCASYAPPALGFRAEVTPVCGQNPYHLVRSIAAHKVAYQYNELIFFESGAWIEMNVMLVPCCRPGQNGRGDESKVVDAINPLIKPMKESRLNPDPLRIRIRRAPLGIGCAAKPVRSHKLDDTEPLHPAIGVIVIPVPHLCFERAVPSSIRKPEERRPVSVFEMAEIGGNPQWSVDEPVVR